MCILLDHGLRCGEVAALQVSSIDLLAGTLTFYREKVHKTQTHRRGKTDIKSLQDAGGWTSPAMPLRYVESAAIADEGVTLG
jgi:integrase